MEYFYIFDKSLNTPGTPGTPDNPAFFKKKQISSIFDTFNNAPGNYFNIASPNIQDRQQFALCTHL